MNPHVSVITLGVEDVTRVKKFYGEGLGRPIQQDYDQWDTVRAEARVDEVLAEAERAGE